VAEETGQRVSKPAINRKVVALLVAVIVVLSSVLVIWYVYYRHWSIEEVGDQVIADPVKETPGFKHRLAGKSVVVEGRITGITSINTNLGTLNYIELDDYELINLMAWGTLPKQIGQRLTMDVEFEWSTCNDERHVYSPQIGFPGLQYFVSMDVVLRAISYVQEGADLIPVQSGDNVVVIVDWMKDPVPLSAANCSLSAGRASFMAEYIDLLGGPWEYGNMTDFMGNLSTGSGQNGSIEFSDENADGYLDAGDLFILKTLQHPNTASGVRSYLLSIGWPRDPEMRADSYPGSMCYVIMTKGGLMRPQDDPQSANVHLLRSSEPNGVRFTVERKSPGLDWDDLELVLRNSSLYGYASVNWTVASTSDLSGPNPFTKAFPAVDFESYRVYCNVTDVLGDAHLDVHDYLTIEFGSNASSVNDTGFTFTLMNEATSASICHEWLRMNATPTSNMSLAAIATGVGGTFAPMHIGFNATYEPFDVPWSEVTIQLSDGTDNVSWSPTTYGLATWSRININFSDASLGPLAILCNLTDLEGNGYMNRGDLFALTTSGALRFSAAANYTVVVLFEPTGGEIFNGTFHG